jgi:hypothetical protein
MRLIDLLKQHTAATTIFLEIYSDTILRWREVPLEGEEGEPKLELTFGPVHYYLPLDTQVGWDATENVLTFHDVNNDARRFKVRVYTRIKSNPATTLNKVFDEYEAEQAAKNKS